MIKRTTRIAAVISAVVALSPPLLTSCGRQSASSGNQNQNVDAQLGFDTAGTQQRQRRVEEQIRDCMKARGFEYVAIDPVAQRASLVGGDLSDDEFTAQFGYGITTLIDKQSATADPNRSIRSGLAATDQAAYDAALTGGDRSATFAAAMDTGDFSRLGGCTKDATDAAFGGAEVVSTLRAALDDLDKRIVADPRMVSALAAWSTCMTDAGYPGFTVSDDVDTTLQSRLVDIVGPLATFDPASNTTYDRGALAELQRLEVAMVGADVVCENKHIAAVEEKVRAEYEAAFRRDNTTLVDQASKIG
jgi:hypothetical protein